MIGQAAEVEIAESAVGARRLSRSLRADGATLSLVPTMGALHDGHLRLVRHASQIADSVVVSIFVNPLQFGPGEDLERYPRQIERDLELLGKSGVDGVFVPSAGAIYPGGEPSVTVVPRRGGDRLCGRSRPGHFEGVLTIVTKLINLLQPDVAVFGRKDFQQCVLIRRMVEDLDMPVGVEVVPTVRDADGLALSSRNAYLSADQRERARSLPDTLSVLQERFRQGERDAASLLRLGADRLRSSGVEIDYLEIVDPGTLDPVEGEADTASVCAAAIRLGETRLIDNVSLGGPPLRA